jgi:hypothetical protein
MSYQPPQYETVAASQNDQALGTTGKAGDWLEALIITVGTSATSTVAIDDGGGSDIPIMAANTPIGVYVVKLQMRSKTGAWRVTTGAGATVVATGDFQ